MDKAKRQDILIKICCIIASFVLWLYVRNIQNPMTNHVIKYVPVEITNIETLSDHNLVLLPDQEFSISLTVKGAATAVYQIDKTRDFKIVADLSKYALKEGENTIPVQIKEAPSNISIVNSENLWIKIKIDTLEEKELPVQANIIGELPAGIHAGEANVSPKTVKVSGAKQFVDTVTSVVANVDATGVEKDINKIADLYAVDENGNVVKEVKLSTTNASVKIPISKGKMVPVEVKKSGSVQNGTLQSIEVQPNVIEVSGETSEVANVGVIYTSPIDLSQIKTSTTLQVKLQIPENIRVSTDTVTVKINVVENKEEEKVVEKTVSVPIKYTNQLENSTVTLGKDSVQLVLSGKEADIKAIDASKIVATIDLKDLQEGVHNVPIGIAGIPENIKTVSQDIETVKVTIKKNSEEDKENVDKGE
ncbi:MAG: CdaR family protein [Clostridium sp.]